MLSELLQLHYNFRLEGTWPRFLGTTFRVKIITGSLVTPEYLFPQITITVTVLKFGWISITVTVLASAVTPSFPLIPNYRLESHLN